MVQEPRHDSILVKIITYNGQDEEVLVSSYYTTAFNETLKMFITAKEYEVECYFNEHSSVVGEEYKEFPGYTIQDVRLKLASSEDLAVIEVII